MKCEACRERLLEAEPRLIAAGLGERGGDGAAFVVDSGPDASWLEHVRGCTACAELAHRILSAQAELAAGLEALTPTVPPDEAMRAASLEVARRRRRVRRQSWGVAAAAAAAILAVSVFDFHGAPGPVAMGPAIELEAHAPVLTPEVEALLDESVIVLETDNDDVVVYWFYQGRGE